MMNPKPEIRTFRSGDLPALVALINEADAVDRLDRSTTVEAQEHEMNWPGYQAEADCFMAWQGGRLVGYTDLFLRKGEGGQQNTFFTWGLVHPEWRRRGIGRRLLEWLSRRAGERMSEIPNGPAVFRCSGRDVELDRKALYGSLGLEPVRYFVNLARPIDNGLPRVAVPAGFCLRPFHPERDLEAVWQVDDLAFQDHWGFVGIPLEEFRYLMGTPHFRPELWLVAEQEATGRIVGIGLNKIDPDWIGRTGRREGYVSTLAVLREYRHLGLGTALLAQSLHLLRQGGMEAVHLHADAENLTGAVRLYERLGFRVRTTNIAYQKVLRDNQQGETAVP